MYASGRYLRKATLEDVQNAVLWDADTVKALMGSGSLYVCKVTYSVVEDEVCYIVILIVDFPIMLYWFLGNSESLEELE